MPDLEIPVSRCKTDRVQDEELLRAGSHTATRNAQGSGSVALLVLLAGAAVARVVAADLRAGAHRLTRTAVLAVPGRRTGRDRLGAGGSPALRDVADRRVPMGLGRDRDAEDGVRDVVADRRLELVEHPIRLDLELVQRVAL